MVFCFVCCFVLLGVNPGASCSLSLSKKVPNLCRLCRGCRFEYRFAALGERHGFLHIRV